MACIDYKDLTIGRRFRRVIDYEGGATALEGDAVATDAYVYHVSLACNHCASPACMQVCPTGAMHKNDLELVVVDPGRCIGCGYCTIACPYHAPSIDPERQQSSKCDGCTERVAAGREPVCVEACPLRALRFGEVGEIPEDSPDYAHTILPLPDPSHTQPNLNIRLSAAAKRALQAEEGSAQRGNVSNYPEIQNNIGI